ncbi:MAG: prenyltransferase/squalene oxidase repeat-containing protein [Verrucomicrobiota bacterium]
MNRRHFLATSIATLTTAALSPSLFSQDAAPKNPALREKAQIAIEKGLGFLENAQKPEGFWSSTDYPGLTALVIQAFISAPEGKHRGAEPVKKGLKFIRDNVKPDGGIYSKGMGNYNTAVAMTALLLAGEPGDQPLIEGARRFLIGAQTKNSATPSGDGGFGYESGDSGRMSRPDLDNTVFTLEALALYREANRAKERSGDKDLNWQAAIEFVTRCQNLPATNKEKWASNDAAEKGGFTYTPGGDDKGTHSYGTMTYAGLLSLSYAEVKADDERVKAAVEWLTRHYTLEENPGQGQQGLYYYYLVMAKGLTAAGLETLPKKDGTSANWREELANKLFSLQKPDGSWANDNGRWMEKDPVLATSYTVLALNLLSGRL